MAPEGYVLDCTPNPRVGKILALLTTVALAVSLWQGLWNQVVVSLLALGLMLFAIVDKGKTVSLPDAFQAAVAALVWLMVLAAIFSRMPFLLWASNVVLGLILAALGFILVYSLLRKMPEQGGRALPISLLATSFAMAMALLMQLGLFAFDSLLGWELQGSIQAVMSALAGVALGGLLMSLAHFLRRDSGGIFTRMVACFIKVNPQLLPTEKTSEQDSLQALLAEGESEKLEFKSTFRLNLHTGKRDKRMERAVLKSLVSFLNSAGGTLLIGVNDDAEVIGIDLDSFESLDKLGLHFTNIIASQIGNSFLPFISFRLIPVGEVFVLRADCRPSSEPVFLRDGGEDFFYIRSGPSSVEVKGRELLSYIERRF